MGIVRKRIASLLRRRRAIPLSDAAAVRFALRRTTLVRLGLGAALVALAVLAIWRAAALNPRPVSFIPASSTSIVVLDQSKSVYISSYRRIAQLIRKLAAADVPVGLVAFSDTAYEMLPPGARGSELKPLLRFYTPGHGGSNVDPETLIERDGRVHVAHDKVALVEHRSIIGHYVLLAISATPRRSEGACDVDEMVLALVYRVVRHPIDGHLPAVTPPDTRQGFRSD